MLEAPRAGPWTSGRWRFRFLARERLCWSAGDLSGTRSGHVRGGLRRATAPLAVCFNASAFGAPATAPEMRSVAFRTGSGAFASRLRTRFLQRCREQLTEFAQSLSVVARRKQASMRSRAGYWWSPRRLQLIVGL